MKLVTPLLVLMLALGSGAVHATSSDPAVTDVQTLNGSLLRAMRAGSVASVAERYQQLEPVIEQVFALPLMTRLSVGPDWTRFDPAQQKLLIAAFSRYTIANYAHNFQSFSGQRFAVDENAVNRGQEKVVRSQIISHDGSPSNLLYRMLEVNGAWKIVDVYYEGVSQLTLHRADFAGAIATGGAPALIAHLNEVSKDLMK